jgi:hypothetical protein
MTEDEIKEALQGFPLSRRERETLERYNGDEPKLRPGDKTSATLENLTDLEWILRVEGSAKYITTRNGMMALELNKYAERAGIERVGSPVKTEETLESRLNRVRAHFNHSH